MKTLLAAVAIGAFALLGPPLFFSSVAHADDEPPHILVNVTNGTPDAAVPADLEINLHIIQNELEMETQTLKLADTESSVLFDDIPVGPDLRYVVATEYKGGTYFVQAFLEDPQQPVTLTIFEDTLSTESLGIVDDILLISGEDPEARTLTAFEIIQMENRGLRTFVPDLTQTQAGVMSFLRFSLPPTATDLTVQSDLVGGQYLQVDNGFALVSPVPPGLYQVMFTYQISYDGSSLEFSPSFPFGAESFRILMPEEMGSIRSEGMETLESVQRGDTHYQVLEARDLARGSSLNIKIGGLPQPSIGQRLRETLTQGPGLSVGIPVAVALALLALLIYSQMRRRTSRQRALALESIPRGGDMPEERRSLLEAIAQLDDQFEGAEIPKDEYEERRQRLKARLIEHEHLLRDQ